MRFETDTLNEVLTLAKRALLMLGPILIQWLLKALLPKPRLVSTPATMTCGIAAGLIATIPMLLVLAVGQRLLKPISELPQEPEPFDPFAPEADNPPPSSVLAEKNRPVSVLSRLSRSPQTFLQFGYGASVGAILIPATRSLPFPPVGKGIVYGLVIWLLSTLGIAPALRLSGQTRHESLRMNGLTLISHMAWGAAAGTVAYALYGLLRYRPWK